MKGGEEIKYELGLGIEATDTRAPFFFSPIRLRLS